jgi:hypothetical protein
MDARLRRRLGGTGLLFVALFVISSFVVPSQPDSAATAAKVASVYAHHRTGLVIEAYLTVAAIAVGLAFFWYLRDLLASHPAGRRPATIAFAGVIMFAGSGGLSAGAEFAIADVYKHAAPGTLQMLNVLNQDVPSFFAAGGVVAFLAGTAVAIRRTSALPAWLAWAGFVLALASLALPFLSAPAAALWTLLASITLVATRQSMTVGAGPARDPLPIT